MTIHGRVNDDDVFDLDAIFHPGAVYDHPRDVLADKGLTIAEKRAILASWASDAAAVSSCPSLRSIPGQRCPVSIDEILEALSSLDHRPRPPGGKPVRRRSVSRVPAAA
ncbi:MAG: hypothetical protein EKK36_09665 [Bradyrhizobiaceae bacterium]|nr:MAG: hypothetical protein EKK36_09665 [Bradyrhizobiaceae bacterium]